MITAKSKPEGVGRTASKETRRRQLIEATIDSISRHGLAGTTINTITSTAGLSVGLVNFHFKNKQNLLEETLRFLGDEHRDEWRKRVADMELDPAAKLLAIVDAHFVPHICSRKKLTVWFGFFGEVGYRKRYRQMMSETDAERREVSAGLCRLIVEQGGYDGVDPGHVADTLEGLYDGFWLNILIYPDEFTREDGMRRIRDYLASVFPRHFDAPATAS